MAEAFNQLTTTSAVLGGFSFAFVGALLAVSNRNKPFKTTFIFTLAAATGFVLSSLGWSLISVWLNSPLNDSTANELPAFIITLHSPLSISFLLSILFFFYTIGSNGWIVSKKLGYYSTLLAALVTIIAMFVVWPFLIIK
ncbi:MAG: hypothetical protein D6732_03475 [Methanobacteriota archaeon]|nr:MAG: hypothetical protein D6732_03475 [Euryarchaeota archaeon]